MGATQTVTVLEHIPVSPPPETTAKLTLPLTFLDAVWLSLPPVHRLVFYRHPVSRSEFVDDIIPKMKKSLSKTLQHFSPMAGRVVVSPDHLNRSKIRYADGDTVPLVFALSTSDGFDRLVSDHSRSCADFHPLVPRLPPTSRGLDGSVTVPIFALQVTLFQDVGFCMGVTNHHVIGDANTIFRFMKAWAFFSSSSPHPQDSLPPQFLPFYDRTAVKDRRGFAQVFWDYAKTTNVEETLDVDLLPKIPEKVRSTFVVSKEDIQRLKNHVLTRHPKIPHVSSFTVVFSYVWVCLVRSRTEINNADDDDDDEMDNFIFTADFRARLGLPHHYFGNCVVPCMGSVQTKDLTGDGGVANAAEVVGGSIHSQLNSKDEDGVGSGVEDLATRVAAMKKDRILGVAGSPKFDYYELDFEWGKASKFEIPSIDITGAISMSAASKKHGEGGGLEAGLALPVAQMESFTRIFAEGLKAL
ncbi:unnamed protein product [Cuscuta campestris]|uniref:Uncharacterized protein n=1 Tax=Cuscuta campestris TaxID=132261 RepID=A0A484MXR5_9ASTE|nr:unnamed protein product [Cuscuta campestris]